MLVHFSLAVTHPMVLPLIPLVLMGTGVVTGSAGAVNGVLGMNKMRRAKGKAEETQAQYDAGLANTNGAVERTNAEVSAYGLRQEQAARAVIGRMVEFLRRNAQQVDAASRSLLDGIETEGRQRLEESRDLLGNPVDLISGIALAGATGAAAFTGIPAAAAAYGTASTGTAISQLSGAAGRSAMMAWLGGGSVASGGGGVALGASALNFVTIGPTMLVTGLTLNGKGEKALTKATMFSGHVTVALAEQSVFRMQLATIERRIVELTDVLRGLEIRAAAALDELEALRFDRDAHGEQLHKALQLTFAVRDVITTSILDSDGGLNSATSGVVMKYRESE